MLSKTKIIFKFAKKNELRKIQNFLKLNYKKKHILSKNEKIFKQYHFKKKINCILAIIKKKIVGIYLYIPLSQFDVRLESYKQVFGSIWSIKGFSIYDKKNNNKNSGAIALKFFNKTYEILKPKLIIATGIDSRLYNFHKIKKYNIFKLNHHFLVSPYIKNYRILKNFTKTNLKQNKEIKNLISYKKINKINEIKNLNINNLFKIQLPIKSKNYLINRYLKDINYKYQIYSISYRK